MTIDWTTFAIRLLVGFFLAVGIGIERQWQKTRAILKTNVLVTLGSAMFVMLSIMTPGDSSPTRISAQIVSGVGFLGGGVILREGASVKGINTAATLWCAAAIGTLVGSGFLVQAYVSTVIVVSANLLLRPLVEAFKQRDGNTGHALTVEEEVSNSPLVEYQSSSAILKAETLNQYVCHLTCLAELEVKVLDTLYNFARQKQLTLVELQSQSSIEGSASDAAKITITAKYKSQDNSEDSASYTEIIRIVKSETSVDSVSWELI